MNTAQGMDVALDALFEDLSKCAHAHEFTNDLFWFLGLINLYLETENQIFVKKQEIPIVCKWLKLIDKNKKAHLEALKEILDIRKNKELIQKNRGYSIPEIEYE